MSVSEFNMSDVYQHGSFSQDYNENVDRSSDWLDESNAIHCESLITETANTNKENITTKNNGDPERKHNEDRLFKVLKLLNLTEKYPGRLSREDMYQITKCSLFDEPPKSQKDLASYFIHKIARLDYTAREICSFNEDKRTCTLQTSASSNYRKKMNKRAEEKRELDVSPMDIIIAVFLCCDDICRQDLASHMWSCRLAIPFVIQEKEPPILPLCFLWPLRNIVMKWEQHHDGNIIVRDGRLVNESFTSIAFIRVGELRLSKSALINSVISTTEKTHSIFFHRDCPGSTKHRYLVDGLIDISWYFPMPKSEGKSNDHFEDPVTFLNLHGDEYHFQNYFPVLSRFANIVTVLTKVDCLDRCRHIIKPHIDMGKTVLVILTDQLIEDSDEATIDNFTEYLKPAENQLEYLEVVDKQRAELVKETRRVLMELVKGKSVRLEKECCSGIDISVDENVPEFRKTKKEAQAISTLIRSTQHKERKHAFLPLQDIHWSNWAAADKERLRTTYMERNEDFQYFKAKMETVMKQCRLNQLLILKKGETRELVDSFLNSISTSNSKNRKLFLRWLKFEIDDLSREELRPIYQNYYETMLSLTVAEESKKEKLKQKLEELDKEVTSRLFGLEHIMREIGQIYEVLHEEENQHLFMNHDLPKLAAKILLDGYPVELLDGYVNAVPIHWVSNMFKKLDIILEEKHKRSVRIKVITSLGIQSSGKSTMLNALFGCQYTVSAGRCTRGVYCQLIKVEETYSKELGIDYVLAIDSEGLRAPELSASGQMVRHDNELSTFVIGLGGVNIINVMGENTTFLDDLLPISVHAFLRMETATSFRPKCIIVHQNVNKEDKQKLLHQGRLLEETLDKMTQIACKFERIKLKSIKDIIEFDVIKDVYYLPALFEGTQPMAPISRRFCEELNLLKLNLVTQESGKSINTLPTFINHLKNVWSAIKRDDFVYQFRNIIETEARSKLDDYWCESNWKFRQPIHVLLSTGYIQIHNAEDANELKDLVKELNMKLTGVAAYEHSQQKVAFKTFISKADTVIKETMMKWSVDMDKRFDDLHRELLREISDKLEVYKQDKTRQFSLKDHKSKYQNTLIKNIEELFQSEKSSKLKKLTEIEISKLFEEYWEKWKSTILDESPTSSTSINIENDAIKALSRAFPSAVDVLKQYIDDKTYLSSYDIDDFQEKDLLTGFQCLTDSFFVLDMREISKLSTTLFSNVKGKMNSREAICKPYLVEEIEEVVQNVKDHFQKNRKVISLQPKQEVYIAVLVCGHAIKRLQKLHENYETENNLENMLEKEKMHYLRIFRYFCNKTETVDLLVTECREILRNGIFQNLTQTLPDMIEIDLRCSPFTLTSKSLAINFLLIKLATEKSYENFQLFINNPRESITHYISECINWYIELPNKPLQDNFCINLETIRREVKQALQKSFEKGRRDFQTWLKIFRIETADLIMLENMDRLDELGKGRTFNLDMFFQKVLECLDSIIQDIIQTKSCYLDKNWPSIKNVVTERILKNIIGCTEGCPFCGAICLAASPGHEEKHFTTLHRPEGCIGRYHKNTMEIATNTCPEAVSSKGKFEYLKDGVKKWCYYKDYREVYPRWKITPDASGEETSFWNCFFAKFAVNIAVNDTKVPEIPASWTLLEWKTEIQKLQNKMK